MLGICYNNEVTYNRLIPKNSTIQDKLQKGDSFHKIISCSVISLIKQEQVHVFGPPKSKEQLQQLKEQLQNNVQQDDQGQNLDYIKIDKYQDYIEVFDKKQNNENLHPLPQDEKYTMSDEMKKETDKKNKESIEKYLSFLYYGDFKYFDFKVQKDSENFFWNHLKWDVIFKQIEECIINVYKNKEMEHSQIIMSDLIEELRKYNTNNENNNEIISLQNQIQLFSPSLTRDFIKQINDNIIDKINIELSNFCLTLSDSTKSFIFRATQTAFTELMIRVHLIENHKPIQMLQKKKQDAKEYFIQVLTKEDEKLDKSYGEKLANEFYNFCDQNAKELSKISFKEKILDLKDDFDNSKYVGKLEQQCLDIVQKQQIGNYKQSIEDKEIINTLAEYKINPKKMLNEQFDSIYKQKSSDIKEKCKKEQLEEFKDPINKFIQYLKQFRILFEKNNKNVKAGAIFHQIDSNKQSDDSQYALMQYFIYMVKKEWKNDQIIKLKDKNISMKKKPNLEIPHHSHPDLTLQIKEELIKYISQIFNENDKINNLSAFLTQAVQVLEEKYKRIEFEIRFQLDNINFLEKQRLRNQLTGCTECCPLCKKQCNVQHQSFELEDRDNMIHKCQNGHQLQSFGGSTYDNKNALLQSCDDIKKNQIVKYNRIEYEWKHFIQRNEIKNWQFNKLDKQKCRENKMKNVSLWNLIGKKVTEKYIQKNIDINFQEASMNSIDMKKIHYILLLDDSGSMNGQPWEELMKAFKIFIEQLCEYDDTTDNSWVTVIRHNHEIELLFEQSQADESLIKKIPQQPRCGENIFNNPLIETERIFKYTSEKYDQTIVYFMSDGGPYFYGQFIYPQIGIDKLKKNKHFDKIRFYSIAYGVFADISTLKQIARELNGELIEAPNAESLAKSFLKIIPNIYQ